MDGGRDDTVKPEPVDVELITEEKPKSSIRWRQLLFEGLSVMFGVLLALGVNEWREHRNNQALAQTAIKSIHEELAANRDEVETSLHYHQELFKKLQPYFGPNPPANPHPRMFRKGFLSPAVVFQTAWESAGETGALQLLDFEEVLKSSKVYAIQNEYSQMGKSMGPLIYETMFKEGTKGITDRPQNLAMILGSFIYKEQRLIATYDRALNGNQSQESDAPDRLEAPKPKPDNDTDTKP